MDLAAALEFARTQHLGVLATIRGNGRPQLSNVGYSIGADDVIRISLTDTRAKTRNLRRDPRVSLHVTGDNHYPYVVIEGEASLSVVAAEPGDDAVLELIELYREMSGEHPDWDEYRQAMIDDQRLVLRITPERAYGMLTPPG